MSLSQYLSEIQSIPKLTTQQEKALLAKIEQNDGTAKEELISAHLQVVYYIAKRYSKFGVELEDLIEEGNLGLIHALDKFDPKHQVKFITYAVYWVKYYIENYIMQQAELVRLPNYLAKKVRKFAKVKQELINENKHPSYLEIAKRMNLSLAEVANLASIKINISADNIDLVSDHQDPIKNIENQELESLILSNLALLSDKSLRVIAKRYGLMGYNPMSLEEIGHQENISRETVRSIQNKALKSLYNDYKH